MRPTTARRRFSLGCGLTPWRCVSGYPVAICNANAQCLTMLQTSGSDETIPSRHVFHSVHDAARAIVLGGVTLGGEGSEEAAAARGGKAKGDEEMSDTPSFWTPRDAQAKQSRP